MAGEQDFNILRLTLSKAKTPPELDVSVEEMTLRPKRLRHNLKINWTSWNDKQRVEWKNRRESRPYVAHLVSLDKEKESDTEDEGHARLKNFERLVYCPVILCVDGYFLPDFFDKLHLGTYALQFYEAYTKRLNTNQDAQDCSKIVFSDRMSGGLLYSILIFMKPPVKHIMDITGGRLANSLLHERQDVDFALSWLSTLGGAFSSLGEKSTSWAMSAGEISLKQLKLAIRLRDPLITSRCKIYWSLSLIQRGFLRRARRILLGEYQFYQSLPSGTDIRLGRMIHGVWHKLKYEWNLRIHQKHQRKHHDAPASPSSFIIDTAFPVLN